MGRLLSGTTAIPSILTLVVVTAMIAFQGYSVPAYALGLIAFIWFVVFIVYQRQSVNIEIQTSEVSRMIGEIRILLKGFIWSRHPEGLNDLQLYLIPTWGFESDNTLSNIPHSINNQPQFFEAGYDITDEFLELANTEEAKDGVNIYFVLSAKMREKDIIFPGYYIHPFWLKNGRVKGEKMEFKGKMRGYRKGKGGIGIDKKQFHKILDKASKPFRKSEREES